MPGKVEIEPHSPYSGPGRWHELLCGIYRAAGQGDKLISQLRRMVLLGDMDRYDELRVRLQANGVWDKEYPRLLEEIRGARSRYEYMRILEKKSELELLMGQVREQPTRFSSMGSAAPGSTRPRCAASASRSSVQGLRATYPPAPPCLTSRPGASGA